MLVSDGLDKEQRLMMTNKHSNEQLFSLGQAVIINYEVWFVKGFNGDFTTVSRNGDVIVTNNAYIKPMMLTDWHKEDAMLIKGARDTSDFENNLMLEQIRTSQDATILDMQYKAYPNEIARVENCKRAVLMLSHGEGFTPNRLGYTSQLYEGANHLLSAGIVDYVRDTMKLVSAQVRPHHKHGMTLFEFEH